MRLLPIRPFAPAAKASTQLAAAPAVQMAAMAGGLPNLASMAPQVQAGAAAAAPDAATAAAVSALPASLVAHIAAYGSAAVQGDTDINEMNFWETQTLNPISGIRRKNFPVVPLFASAASAASGGQCIITFTPSEDVYCFRLIIPSGQVQSAEVVQSLVANQRLVNVASNVGAPITDFAEKSGGGKIALGRVKAGQPITLVLTGCANSTTYYAVLLAYGLYAPKGGPSDGRAPDYIGWVPLGITTLTAGASGTVNFQPAAGFRPRCYIFDDSQTNFANILIGNLVEGVIVQAGTTGANCPAVAFSEVASQASEDFFDFNYIPANTPCTLPISNTNATASAKLGGHIVGEVWLPTND